MACGVYWQQVRELERAMRTMHRFGISELAEPYQILSRKRAELMGRVGFKFPRSISSIMKLVGLSPGVIQLWHDVESGWMAEARVKVGAPPVYKAVSDKVAIAIINKEVSPELEKWLMTPDEYLGE